MVSIGEVIEKALAGERLNRYEIEALYAVEPYSKDAALMMWAGYELSQRASGGVSQIHAQIGLDASPCARNCAFCSFAARSGLRTGIFELEIDDVVAYSVDAIEDGANLVLMLTTATYRFEKLLEVVERVRAAVGPEYPVLVGTDDFTYERALQLKEAGCNGTYHALRLGEGVFTTITEETRRSTIENTHHAGLKHCTCIEPIGPEHTPVQLAERTLYAMESAPVFGGAWRRDTVPGDLGSSGIIDEARWALYVAAFRIATGDMCKMNSAANSTLLARSGANVAWTEVGPNPRDVEMLSENGIGLSMAEAKKLFAETGWTVLEGPAREWMEDYSGPVNETLITHSPEYA